MTSDSSIMSALCSLISPVNVLTADGTSLPVSSRGNLSTSSFSVPDISHVPRLKMNLFYASQLTDSSCRIILDADSCAVQDRHTQVLVGALGVRLASCFFRCHLSYQFSCGRRFCHRLFLAVASSSWSSLWLSPVIVSSSWSSRVCLRRCVFKLSGL
jgi:hypothetical protein